MKILNNLMKFRILLCLPVLVIVFFSCGHSDSQSYSNKNKNLTYNKVQHILCSADTSQSYELYLPSEYNADRTWPLIFLFDPHGSGNLAIEKFKQGAEQYGYILAASNNSRNGALNIDYILNILTNDVLQKYSIDKERIYAAGFSGGARVALGLVLQTNYIKGIILSGAGLSGILSSQVNRKFDIFATAGYGDFNYNEIFSIPNQLDNNGWRYIVCYFNGGHEWPPVDLITEALQWFYLNSGKDGLLTIENSFVKELGNNFLFECDSLISAGRLIDAENKCLKSIAFLNGLSNIKKFQKQLQKIKTNTEYTIEYNRWQKSLQMEASLRNGYLQYLADPDTLWWKKEIDILTKNISSEHDPYIKHMYLRIKGYLGIVLYSFTNKAVQSSRLNEATKYLVLYRNLEPHNPDMNFFTAIVFDRKNQHQKALEYLRRAIEFGFSDSKKINDMASPRLKLELKEI